MIKSFKIRLYPTKDQEAILWKHINCCRFIWNHMIEVQEYNYSHNEKHLFAYDMIRRVTDLKHSGEYKWLYDVSNASLQQTCRDLDYAYKRAFDKLSNFPKFKSKKKSKKCFPTRPDRLYFLNSSIVHLEKIGMVRYKSDIIFTCGRCIKYTNPRVSFRNGKWMLSFGMECENQTTYLNDYDMGIDLGIKDTMICAYGDQSIVFHNINKSKRMRSLEAKKLHLQRSISRKYEANRVGRKYMKTNNIAKEEEKLRKIYSKQSNIRNNYIHQCTHHLVSLLPRRVVMEDLNVSGMMKNHHLAKSIQQQCFYEIRRQMQYKCEWNGIEFILADRFYPSSKTCSRCGCIHSGLKLKDRIFVCPECGLTIDRDYQAALNLMRYAA